MGFPALQVDSLPVEPPWKPKREMHTVLVSFLSPAHSCQIQEIADDHANIS